MEAHKGSAGRRKLAVCLAAVGALLLLAGWRGLESVQWGDMLLLGLFLLFGGNLAIALGMLVEGVQRIQKPKPRPKVMRWSDGRWKYPVTG